MQPQSCGDGKNAVVQGEHAMGVWYKSKFMFLTIFLAGCTFGSRSLISIDGSQTIDLTQVALIMEDSNYPMLLRGLDGIPLESIRVPSVFKKYAYVISPGPHIFWLKNIPYPHPAVPQRIRCFTMHVELQKGERYFLKEERGNKQALLIREDTGEIVSTGELVDQPYIFQRDCDW